jgi:hypothetical protein
MNLAIGLLLAAAAMPVAHAAALQAGMRNDKFPRRSKVLGALRGRGPSSLLAKDVDNDGSGMQLKLDYPMYHTSKEITTKLQALTKNCEGADLSVETHSDDENPDVSMNLYKLKGHGVTKPVNKVFLLSGEHARELIGSETTMAFLHALCNADGGAVEKISNASVADVLKNSEFQVVVNGNPRSRLTVEKGDYCIRANPEGVDLNRNWDEEWNQSMTLTTDRGPHPFSEPETRIVKKMIEAFMPTTFLSVHSGTLGMYMPWAWSPDTLAARNHVQMMNILKSLDISHCECPWGAAGKEVGYPCPGTSVDWVYDALKAPYSFAFEIWGNPDDAESLKRRWQEKMEGGGLLLLQNGAHLGHSHFSEVFKSKMRHHSDFVQVAGAAEESMQAEAEKRMRASADSGIDACFGTFNPLTQDLYTQNVNNWASAYLEMSAMIAQDLLSK